MGFPSSSHIVYDTLKYIPANTLRGALATPTLEKYCKVQGNNFGKCENCEYQDNCEFYQIFYKDVVSLTNGIFLGDEDKIKCNNPDIVPTHPLIQECKVCRENKKYKSKTIENKLKEWQKNKYVISMCPICNKKTTMNPIDKNYCRNCCKTLGLPERGFTISSSIDPVKGSSLTKYLFHYNYIQPGSVFQSYLVFKKNDEIFNLLQKLNYLRIGRGKSRGFGKVKLKIEKIDLQEKIKRNKELINNMISKNNIIVVAKSHIFSLDIDSTIQDLILISKPVVDLNSALQYVNKQLNLNLSNINNLFSLKRTLGKIGIISGWSFKTQQPKPHIKSAVPGSLYLFEFDENNIDENIIEALSYLEFVGLNEYSRLGYNLIYFPSFEEIGKK